MRCRSRSRAIDAAFIRHVLDATATSKAPYGAIHISAHLAADAKQPVRRRRRIRSLKQAHRGVREVHPRIACYANRVLAIAIEDVTSNVGMGDLLDREAVASVPAEHISNDAGGGSAPHPDPIFPVVLD